MNTITYLKTKVSLCIVAVITSVLLASCSTDNDDLDIAYANVVAESDALTKRLLELEGKMSSFEGKWTFYEKEYEARLTVTSDSFQFVLPEKLFVDLIFSDSIDWTPLYPDEPFFNTSQDKWTYMNTQQRAGLSLDGYSNETGYLSLNAYNYYYSNPEKSLNAEVPNFYEYSYLITIGDVPYRVDVLFNGGRAMYDIVLKKWTLQFPLVSTTVNNMMTGWHESWLYDNGMILKFVTTKKIE